MVRCTSCRFLFEAGTPGLLPDCPQCGGTPTPVIEIAPADAPSAPATMKFTVIKTDGAGG